MLRTLFLTGSAADAQTGPGILIKEMRVEIMRRLEIVVNHAFVVQIKVSGNVHIVGTRHAVAALGAGDDRPALKAGADLREGLEIFLAEKTDS